MNVSNALSMVQVAAGYSVLNSANKQPELALQLIQASLQPTQPAAETPVESVQSPPATGPGQIIDTIA